MTDTSCSDSDVSKNGKDSLAAGSRAFLNNSPAEAAESFKSVLEKTSCKSNQKIPISQVVLRYVLCIALIKCNNYNNIAEAVTILLELIESGYASKLPSLYLALGKAYFALNRFKSALECIEKGLKAVQSNSKIKQHMWPGLQQPIDETLKDNLHKDLVQLQAQCKQAHSPDAFCRFEKCLEQSTHLMPTQDIYLTDPDFKPFLYLQCNSNCKYAYHDLCWKHLKLVDLNMDEPKDLLGTACLSCSSKINNKSVIVEVNLIGSEFGFDKPLFTWLLEEDKCSKAKLRNEAKLSSSSPVKGNIKPATSNGSLVKSCVSGEVTRSEATVVKQVHPKIFVPRAKPVQPVSAYGYQPPPQTMLHPGPHAPSPSPMYYAGYSIVQSVQVSGPSPLYYPPVICPPNPWAHGGLPTLNMTTQTTEVIRYPSTLPVPAQPPVDPFRFLGPEDRTPPRRNHYDVCETCVAPARDESMKEPRPKSPIGSVVDEFKSVVWKLAGESSGGPSEPPMSEKTPKENIKSVVEEFKRLVHSLGGETADKKEDSPMSDPTPLEDPNPASLLTDMSSSEQLLISETSTFQANSKLSPMEDENYSEQSSLCSSQDDIRSESLDSSKLAHVLDILQQCRKMEFGYLPSEYMNPELQCFGHPYANSSNFVESHEIDECDKDQAEFVFSYYYSVFEKNGLHRLEDLQEKWKATISDDIGLPESFTNKYSSVSEFLLKSDKFAAIDEFIGTSDLLPDMFSKAQVEIAESVSFLLFSQDSHSKSQEADFSADTFNNAWKIKMNNNNCDPHTLHNIQSSADDSGSDHSDECEKSENSAVSRDNNDNPLRTTSVNLNSNNFMVTSEVNGTGCNAPTMTDVYMSDEDEEIDSSLVIDNAENGREMEMWREKQKPDVFSKHSQTEQIIDCEKENLVKSKDSLLKEVSELRYEKGELHQRIESLQQQIENNRATMESLYDSILKQTQETHEQKLLEKSLELKEIQDKYSTVQQTVLQLTEEVEDKKNDINKLTLSLQKIQRNHAKEMNNFEQRLQEGMKHKLAESTNQSKYKDQRYIQLWKEFCEFKINKFNQSCNDRINVLSQLRDMVSDKPEISSIIEKYEDSMISVTQKNAEVNDIFNAQMEKIRNGLDAMSLNVVDVPDCMNMPYLPEGVFESLRSMIKPKQDDFAVPQNHFLGGSRFYPRSYNGVQSRENEGFPSVQSSSIFGQGQNETPHLWNTVAPGPLSYEVNNTGSSQFHQGFGSSNSMMNQTYLNLLGHTSTSPSLPLSSVNGSAFNSNTSALSSGLGALAAPGSKLPTLAFNQKAPGPTPTNSLPVKTAAAPVTAPAAVSPQGAIPKPRVQTATASMTPILPSKPKPAVKGSRHESNYEKLMRNLQKMFPTRNDAELTQALKLARERNNNTLSSLSHSEIVSKVEEILNSFRKQTSMSWEKFGQAAWGTAKTPVVEWEGQDQDECCICMLAMSIKETYTLECKHAFHKDCIKKWLEQESVCPNCRTHSTMDDEFPPLG